MSPRAIPKIGLLLLLVGLCGGVCSAESVVLRAKEGVWKYFTCPYRDESDGPGKPGMVTADIRIQANGSVSILNIIKGNCAGDPFATTNERYERASAFNLETYAETVDTISPTCYVIRNENVWPVAMNYSYNIRCNVGYTTLREQAMIIVWILVAIVGLVCLSGLVVGIWKVVCGCPDAEPGPEPGPEPEPDQGPTSEGVGRDVEMGPLVDVLASDLSLQNTETVPTGQKIDVPVN